MPSRSFPGKAKQILQRYFTGAIPPPGTPPINSMANAQTVDEDTPLVFSSANSRLISVASGVPGAALTCTFSVTIGTITVVAFAGATITGNNTNTVVVTGNATAINGAIASLTINPQADYNGAHALTLKTQEAALAEVAATVAITVTPVADIVADTASTAYNTPVTVNVLANDNFENTGRLITAVNGVQLFVGNSVPVTGGSIKLDAAGLIFTPTTNFSGVVTTSYTVTSGGKTETAPVTITVAGPAVVPTGEAALTAGFAFGTGQNGGWYDPSAAQINKAGAAVPVDGYLDTWNDRSSNGSNLTEPVTNFPILRQVGAQRAIDTFTSLDSITANGGGSGDVNSAGFFIAEAVQPRSYYTTLFTDQTAPFNGRFVRWNGDFETLSFSVGTGTARFVVSSVKGDIATANFVPANPFMYFAWHDPVANTINLQIGSAAPYSAPCPAFAAGSAGFSLVGVPGSDAEANARFFHSVHMLNPLTASLRNEIGKHVATKFSIVAPAPAPPPSVGEAPISGYNFGGTTNGAWYDPLATLLLNAGAQVTAPDQVFNQWTDKSKNANNALEATDQKPFWKNYGVLRAAYFYQPMEAAAGGSGLGTDASGFCIAQAVTVKGYTTTLWSDAATLNTGRTVRYNSDSSPANSARGSLEFSIGTGTARVSVNSLPADIPQTADYVAPTGSFSYIAWHDRVANTINLQINNDPSKLYSAAAPTFAKGAAGFSLAGAYGLQTESELDIYQSAHYLSALDVTNRTNNASFVHGKLDAGAVPAPAPTPAPAPAPSPAPAPAPAVAPTIATSSQKNKYLQIGTATDAYWLDDNPWGAAALVEGPNSYQYMQEVGRHNVLGAAGEIAWRAKWRWPQGTTEVKGFPCIIQGGKPGNYSADNIVAGFPVILPDGTTSQTAPSGKTPGAYTPRQLPVARIDTNYNFQHNALPTGQGQLTWDIWLQSAPGQDNGFMNSSISHEIMIPVSNWGGYGTYPNNRNSAWYDHDAMIDGKLFHVYCTKGSNGALLFNFSSLNGVYGRYGWKLIVFQPDVTPLVGPINLASFINYLATRTDSMGTKWAEGNEYLADMEFGIEPIVGTGDLTIFNYKVAESGTNVNNPAFALSPLFDALQNDSLSAAKTAGGLNSAILSFAKTSGACLLDSAFTSRFPDAKTYADAGSELRVSFGGFNATYAEVACVDDTSLYNLLVNVITNTNCKWLDFNIEDAVLPNTDATARRARVLKSIQTAYPALKLSFTLPVWLNGMDTNAINLLTTTIAAGVRIDLINMNCTDFGAVNISASTAYPVNPPTVGRAAIVAFEAVLSQMANVLTTKTVAQRKAMMGISVIIGKNNDGTIFTLDDAQTVADYVKVQKIGFISYANWKRDRAQTDTTQVPPLYSGVVQSNYQFFNIFRTAGQ